MHYKLSLSGGPKAGPVTTPGKADMSWGLRGQQRWRDITAEMGGRWDSDSKSFVSWQLVGLALPLDPNLWLSLSPSQLKHGGMKQLMCFTQRESSQFPPQPACLLHQCMRVARWPFSCHHLFPCKHHYDEQHNSYHRYFPHCCQRSTECSSQAATALSFVVPLLFSGDCFSTLSINPYSEHFWTEH